MRWNIFTNIIESTWIGVLLFENNFLKRMNSHWFQIQNIMSIILHVYYTSYSLSIVKVTHLSPSSPTPLSCPRTEGTKKELPSPTSYQLFILKITILFKPIDRFNISRTIHNAFQVTIK